jgi:hypothetical protein
VQLPGGLLLALTVSVRSPAMDRPGNPGFALGLNYAWRCFAADFGGLAAWGQPGVAAEPAVHAMNLARMRDCGASVVRWWVFPDLRGDGVQVDGNGHPRGLGATAERDVQRALQLAADAGVRLLLCLFSFDGFRPARELAGVWIPGLQPMVVDPARRRSLMANVVRPFARAAASSPHADRLFAWELINEPEWAIAGPSPHGDADYDPSGELAHVAHHQMESFLGDAVEALRAETRAPVTVGGAGFKWARAWRRLDLDFYQFHAHDWAERDFPHQRPAAAHGSFEKPVLIGELPLSGLSGVPVGTLLERYHDNGYAGAIGWQLIEAAASELAAMKTFARGRGLLVPSDAES